MSNQLDNAVYNVDFPKVRNPYDYQTLLIGGSQIEVVAADNETDEDAESKLYAFKEALALVQRDARPANGPVPSFKLYLSPDVRCVATMGERAGVADPCMFLGRQLSSYVRKLTSEKKSQVKGGVGQNRGVAQQVYDEKRKSRLNPFRWVLGSEAYQRMKTSAMSIGIVVHEMGHMLHEQNSPALFWPMKTETQFGPNHMALAMKVSQYAITNRLEFVAEVFTGMVLGRRYGNDVVAAYVALGGCPVVTEPRSAPAA